MKRAFERRRKSDSLRDKNRFFKKGHKRNTNFDLEEDLDVNETKNSSPKKKHQKNESTQRNNKEEKIDQEFIQHSLRRSQSGMNWKERQSKYKNKNNKNKEQLKRNKGSPNFRRKPKIQKDTREYNAFRENKNSRLGANWCWKQRLIKIDGKLRGSQIIQLLKFFCAIEFNGKRSVSSNYEFCREWRNSIFHEMKQSNLFKVYFFAKNQSEFQKRKRFLEYRISSISKNTEIFSKDNLLIFGFRFFLIQLKSYVYLHKEEFLEEKRFCKPGYVESTRAITVMKENIQKVFEKDKNDLKSVLKALQTNPKLPDFDQCKKDYRIRSFFLYECKIRQSKRDKKRKFGKQVQKISERKKNHLLFFQKTNSTNLESLGLVNIFQLITTIEGRFLKLREEDGKVRDNETHQPENHFKQLQNIKNIICSAPQLIHLFETVKKVSKVTLYDIGFEKRFYDEMIEQCTKLYISHWVKNCISSISKKPKS